MTRFKCYLEMTEWYDSNVTQWYLIFKRLEQQQWTPILQPSWPKVGMWLQEASKNHLKMSLSDWKMSMELSFHNWSHKMFIHSSFLVLRSALNCSHCSFNLVVASACFDMKEVKLVGVRATSSGSSWKVKPRYEKTTLQIDNTSWTAQHMPVLELHDVFILGDPLLQLQDGGLEILFVFLVLTFPQHLQSTLEQPFIGALRICHKFFHGTCQTSHFQTFWFLWSIGTTCWAWRSTVFQSWHVPGHAAESFAEGVPLIFRQISFTWVELLTTCAAFFYSCCCFPVSAEEHTFILPLLYFTFEDSVFQGLWISMKCLI